MLIRKMLRDMKIHRTQFISIFLMAMISVFIYSGISSEWNGMQSQADRYYSENNLADLWIYGAGMSEELAGAVKALEEVTGTERRLTVEGIADLPNNPALTLHFVEKGKVSTCRLMEGEEFSSDMDGLWLDYQFARARELKVGDRISVTVYGSVMEKPIRGLVMNPEYVNAPAKDEILPDHNKYGFGYLSAKALPEGIPPVYSELLVTVSGEADRGLIQELENILEGSSTVILTREQKSSYVILETEVEEHKAMGGIFPVVFLAVAMLTILTTMIRLVNNQRTQIGVLKALGFKRKAILFHYVSYGLWLSLAGCIAGAVLGPLTLPYLFYPPMKTMFTLPAWKPEMTVTTLWMAGVSVAGCTLVTYLACHNHLKCIPAQSLRPKAPKTVKHTFMDKYHLWNRLSFYTQWNLRDAFRSKIRSLMAIVGVLGCTALLLCAFGLKNSLDEFTVWNFSTINRYKSEIILSEDITDNQFNHIMASYHGEALMEGVVEIKAGENKESGELLVTDKVTLIRNYDPRQRPITLPEKGLTISYRLAADLGVTVGEEIGWRFYGEDTWNTTTVEAINRKPVSQGITLSREGFEAYGYTFRPTSIISADEVPVDLVNIESGVTKVWAKQELIDSFKAITEAMSTLIYVLMLAAIVLAVVVLYNLGVLSYTERMRELSTLKVIGFKTKNIRTLLLTQNIWMTIAGILLGIPTGIWLLEYIMRYVGESFDLIPKIKLSSYLYSILGTFLVSTLVNRLFSRRVRKLDMVSSLKGVE